ncbi:ABC transporter substrate-binding protein [Halomonas sp. YLGW01]|uniref:ABC transporter substrate-binding protein n=1 Tax=Halomonas sp. YLGW01 TaxID=2773308 RepID=UPI001F5C0770|nr:ABC transporter substrate-binding protein [Halomonas sp. YLGW01]
MRHNPQRPSIRQRLTGLLLALLLMPGTLAHAADSGSADLGSAGDGDALSSDHAPRLAILDWTLAETLVALGAAPTAVAQVDAYHAWVGEPALPPSVVNLGLRAQPNLERLARLAPDRILISPMFANLTPRLERIAPVSRFSFHSPQEPIWPQLLAMTRRLATLSGRNAAGEALIDTTRNRLARLRETLAEHPETAEEPLLIVQFMDARHVRVFGDHGLYQAVLKRLGLTNAWQGATNAWGFSVVGLEALAAIQARLVVVEPLPVGVAAALDDSSLWQALPSVREHRVISLPPVWSAGALPSARRFAETLTQGLLQDERHAHAH